MKSQQSVVVPMNRDNYRLTAHDAVLNQDADKLMEVICFLSNERVYTNRFPSFSTINYNGIDETELIEAIEDLEKLYAKAKEVEPFGILHHHSHLYYLEETSNGFTVWHNDTKYGSDGGSTSAPVCRGKTAIDALKNAWKLWSIPPVLISNSDYYVPNVDIHTVYSVPWNSGVEQ